MTTGETQGRKLTLDEWRKTPQGAEVRKSYSGKVGAFIGVYGRYIAFAIGDGDIGGVTVRDEHAKSFDRPIPAYAGRSMDLLTENECTLLTPAAEPAPQLPAVGSAQPDPADMSIPLRVGDVLEAGQGSALFPGTTLTVARQREDGNWVLTYVGTLGRAQTFDTEHYWLHSGKYRRIALGPAPTAEPTPPAAPPPAPKRDPYAEHRMGQLLREGGCGIARHSPPPYRFERRFRNLHAPDVRVVCDSEPE